MVVIRKSLEDFSKLHDKEKIVDFFSSLSAVDNEINVIITTKDVYGILDISDWENPLEKINVADKSCIERYARGRPVYKRVNKYKNLISADDLMSVFAYVQFTYGINFKFAGQGG